jgi:hypothetical protein
MDDFFQNPDDSIDVEPADLGPELIAVLKSSLAKALAESHDRPWTDDLESRLQERVSALVASATKRNLKTIRVIVTRSTGVKESRELDVERISRTRSLQ